MTINRQELALVETIALPGRVTSSGQDAIERAVASILKAVGENPDREGLKKTPARVARMFTELLSGYGIDPAELINGAMFDPEGVTYSEMIVVTGIDYSSLCEHHMLPVVGQAHVAYIPSERVIGLSKIPRIVDMFARRLQLQERMTQQIADFLMTTLDPIGVGVVVEGNHSCATLRGVKKANTRMTTSAMTGAFKDSEKTRTEFLAHLSRASRV
jgi:GTP cyclohydrolase IA